MKKRQFSYHDVIDNKRMVRTPKDLESYVQYVYYSLLNLKDEGVVVSTNATLVGKSGAKHEVDVFYQFERSGIIHRVAFECKYLSRSVEKSDVVEFHGKIKDIGNIQGIFVSKAGYQRGAKEYGSHYDITLLCLEDLPTLNILVAKRLKSVALPDETYVGEPFWALMGIKNGELTGDFYATTHGRFPGKFIIPFFISKKDAEDFLNMKNENHSYVVRGIPQHTLKFILGTAKIGRRRTLFSLLLYGQDDNGLFSGTIADAENIERRFLLAKING